MSSVINTNKYNEIYSIVLNSLAKTILEEKEMELWIYKLQIEKFSTIGDHYEIFKIAVGVIQSNVFYKIKE